MLRMADQMGILVWQEVPVYWTIQWENPATLRNPENQLSELIRSLCRSLVGQAFGGSIAGFSRKLSSFSSPP
jgi:hypothetical protein